MSTEISIVQPENLQLIAKNAPAIYANNKQRSQRCLDFGNDLLAENSQNGMSDSLDVQLASYIEKTRRTLKLMNEQRAPVTKLFDQIRTEFTAMENAIDPTKNGSVPAQIQALRNQYAAKKRAEEEQRRQQEMLRLQKQQAVATYEQDVEAAMKMAFNNLVTGCINDLTALNAGLTLANFDAQSNNIKAYQATITAEQLNRLPAVARYDTRLVSPEEAGNILLRVRTRLNNQFQEQFAYEVGDYKNTIVDALPSKHRELERMAQANAAEQERMRQELAAKEAAEAARLEAERKRKADEEEAAKKAQVQAQSMGDLFNAASVATPTYTPKTSVKKRVVALDAEGIINIFSLWWSKEGQFMTVDDLTKMFKKQFTAVEKYANDKTNPEFINSTHVKYEDEVKAK